MSGVACGQRREWGVAILIVFAVLVSSASAEVRPERLRCEYADNPLGVDVCRPRLSWVLKSDERGQVQTAYQVLVASTEEVLQSDQGDLWDTGKVASNDTLNVVYAGKPLQSSQRAFWKVRAWDRDDKPSAYSGSTWWEAALLDAKDWTGTWIARGGPAPEKPEDFYQDDPAPLFRKAFQVDKPVRTARAYVTGLGYYELHLNGKKVGDRVLDPGWTTYSKRVLYSVYDVTDQLKQGPNAVGVIVGNGWYNPLPMKMWATYNLRDFLTIGRPRALLQLNIDFADGSRQSVVSDASWKVGDSPILRNSVYLGEVYDARRETPGWDQPDCDDRSWPSAVVAPEPVGGLHAQSHPPIRVTRTLKPVKLTEPKPGVFIYDMGQNFAGWVRLRVKGEAGDRVVLRYGELLYPDGTLNFMTSVAGQIKTARPPATTPGEPLPSNKIVSMGGPGAPDIAWQSETYILKGGGEEVYTPRFTFHGFRYVEVTGYPGRPGQDAVEGLRLNSAVAQVGSFSCSNEMLNQIQQMIEWTQLSNLFSVQSDCPHREKFGYGGDVIACSETGMFNFDMARFYAKTIRDQADAVRPDGGMTETAPFVGIDADSAGYGNGVGPIGWGSVLPILQAQLYQYYGDRRLMQRHYALTKRWIEFLEQRAKDHIHTQCLGDHECLEPKSIPLTSTAFYYANVRSFARIARELGQIEDASRFELLAEGIRNAFNARFLKPDTGVYDSGTQACQSFALYWDLVPPEARTAVLGVLADNITNKNKGHLATGIFGTKYMLNTLTDLGRADLAYTMVSQKTFPGWGHMLQNGATTLWEHWEFSDNVFSHNHPMFGSVGEWFFKALAGINPDPAALGFDRIIIRPQVVADLTWVKGTYNSVRGPVGCQWRIDRDTLLVDVTVPANTKATVYLPARELKAVSEAGRPLSQAVGVTVLPDAAEESLVCRIGSGDYAFAVPGFARPGR
ncbi:MAG TPA: family 78 glycoside hydrolase catalytic domain [Phycisphaerae bacterium]|nr:family 78 glycoside hydrolase catalytic domain [Phycisphaerae bacterium]HRY67418.1 family 78 glycoside hydrolase catalytic domain [Phycisphaerae bacterium]HSA28991.1 family 78 glycoside hydrolase catalytic domain [Phycisphaerae bacterium]